MSNWLIGNSKSSTSQRSKSTSGPTWHHEPRTALLVNLVFRFDGMEENGNKGFDEPVEGEKDGGLRAWMSFYLNARRQSDNDWLETHPALIYGLRELVYLKIPRSSGACASPLSSLYPRSPSLPPPRSSFSFSSPSHAFPYPLLPFPVYPAAVREPMTALISLMGPHEQHPRPGRGQHDFAPRTLRKERFTKS
ncbi:CNDP dipeptidase [Mycena venus]|uniref:CNDP dipeptidase n=1 Tax=Mycena venus TaxID=2733690 RepID=A0A8H6YUM6_9AGAR|nr:CNDP dipeptidase [Mycena venus]